MNKQLIAGLLLAGSLIAAPAAKALPLIDIGVGIGALTLEDDDSAAIAGTASVGVNIPFIPLVGVEGQLTQTLQDGEIGGFDYSGNQLGAFATITTPTPFLKVRGKLGMVRSDFSFNGFSNDSTDFAIGAAALFGDWRVEWTRTMADDEDGGDIDFISLSYVF
ncbi:hypothetical protein [Natronospira bacteriovora]|uniref:Outer membrane protein beta-barrel domain-containing protein n=1 Tax=Natronospira bacteriovora TaxID=3069753 RepID=A0ABU0W7P7_9GAMM|nr:hypothetical protein [Natronospira sp. AB-CW4]MDQ2070059.1 hypothetical protein [Natronospira sp. AB-CW4]